MKRGIIKILLMLSGFFSDVLFAQGPPDPGGSPVFSSPPLGGGAPIDNGTFIIAALGIVYGFLKYHHIREKSKIEV
ncbi:MAG: hypothetical protein HOO86_03060 [Bacteroidales bacterium]|nr:hypothetical protein [Bacteroidales bacterium]